MNAVHNFGGQVYQATYRRAAGSTQTVDEFIAILDTRRQNMSANDFQSLLDDLALKVLVALQLANSCRDTHGQIHGFLLRPPGVAGDDELVLGDFGQPEIPRVVRATAGRSDEQQGDDK